MRRGRRSIETHRSAGTLPEDAPTGDCVVAVANYGEDYSDATTLGDYAAVTFEIYPPESSKKKSDDTTAILARARRRDIFGVRASRSPRRFTAASRRRGRSDLRALLPRHRAAPPQVAVIIAALLFAALVTGSCMYLVAREKAGKPLFMPLSQSPLHPAETELAPPASASEVALKDDVDGGRMSTIPL